jgi:deoxyribodipyrimidine photo-lyase
MKGKRTIVWFKNDLRTEDQESLFRAAYKAAYVLPLYIFDPRQFAEHALGFPKTNSFRAQFLIESVHALRNSLQQMGAGLHIRIGFPEEIIPALAKELKINSVYATREVTQEELLVQSRVELSLKVIGVPLELHWQNTLYHIDDIPWPIQHLPDTFTQFRKEAEQESKVREVFPIPEIIYEQETELKDIPSLDDLGLNAMRSDPRSVLLFKGGEPEAKKRLQDYFWDKDLLKAYKNTRNEMIGADYSSKFSAWLSLGCISPKTIYNEVKRYEKERIKNDSTYWLVFELMWRDYFRFAAKKYNGRIFLQTGVHNKSVNFHNDTLQFERWRVGETGVNFIDANMKELLLTGFMSNRGRQNVACYLAKDYKVNWTWGAAWFESQLIDYDVASNWLNWAYVAGVGNDPREDRYFNTESQVKKYDPKENYVKLWLGEKPFKAKAKSSKELSDK